MKIHILVLASLLTLSSFSLFGQSKKDCSAQCLAKVKTQAVLFEKGKVYEIAYAEVIPEKMEQLNTQYFPKAMKLSAKYGGKLVASFSVAKNESQNLPGNMVAIFEWANPDARLKLLEDKEFKKITHLRDEALKNIELGYFQVEEDKAITFRSDRIYEFGSADIKPGDAAQADLKTYFEVSEPIKRNYGGAYPEFIINFSPADSKGQATFVPQMQFIVEWNSVADNEKLFADHDFKTKAAPILMRAIAKFDAVFTKFNFQ